MTHHPETRWEWKNRHYPYHYARPPGEAFSKEGEAAARAALKSLLDSLKQLQPLTQQPEENPPCPAADPTSTEN